MNDEFVAGIFGISVGLAFGLGIASFIWNGRMDEFKVPMDAAIAKCEAELPRNQECFIEYTARVKAK